MSKRIKPIAEYWECSHCGAPVAVTAKFCRQCGATAESGWQSLEEVENEQTLLPENEEDFDYDEFVADEFGEGSKNRFQRNVIFVIIFLTLAGLILTAFRVI